MEVVFQRCCGIDVHKKMIVACFRDGRKKEIREFGTVTSELRELTSGLLDSGCEMIAMESTASYWQPLADQFYDTENDSGNADFNSDNLR